MKKLIDKLPYQATWAMAAVFLAITENWSREDDSKNTWGYKDIREYRSYFCHD